MSSVVSGEGWVYWNPDSGEEYSPSHPVKSGECGDAEGIRKSTPQEDVLWTAMQEEFTRAEASAKTVASQAAEVEQWRKIASDANDRTRQMKARANIAESGRETAERLLAEERGKALDEAAAAVMALQAWETSESGSMYPSSPSGNNGDYIDQIDARAAILALKDTQPLSGEKI